jgi:DNA-binding response OmpR family regulator
MSGEPHVLIVDDERDILDPLASYLSKNGFRISKAGDAAAARAILAAHAIDIALIDIMMPEMDGYETMKQIRSQDELSDLPLIAVTAKAMKGDRQKCLDAGASDYIAKPVDIELLLALVRVWVGRAREAAAAAAPPIPVEAAE